MFFLNNWFYFVINFSFKTNKNQLSDIFAIYAQVRFFCQKGGKSTTKLLYLTIDEQTKQKVYYINKSTAFCVIDKVFIY